MCALKVGDFIEDKRGHNIKVARIIEIDWSNDVCKIEVVKASKDYMSGEIAHFSIGYVNSYYKKSSHSMEKLMAMAI